MEFDQQQQQSQSSLPQFTRPSPQNDPYRSGLDDCAIVCDELSRGSVVAGSNASVTAVSTSVPYGIGSSGRVTPYNSQVGAQSGFTELGDSMAVAFGGDSIAVANAVAMSVVAAAASTIQQQQQQQRDRENAVNGDTNGNGTADGEHANAEVSSSNTELVINVPKKVKTVIVRIAAALAVLVLAVIQIVQTFQPSHVPSPPVVVMLTGAPEPRTGATSIATPDTDG